MLKCGVCERSFSEYDIVVHKGEKVCPYCGHDDYEQATQCKSCGDYFLDDELTFGVCVGCKDNFKTAYIHNPKMCYELSKDEKEEVNLNAFLVSQFTTKQIEEVLFKELIIQSVLQLPDYSAFIDGDEMWFIEKMLEGGDSK